MMALITTQKAAEKLGIHITRIQQFIYAKRLPAEKIGRDWLIDEKDLAALIRYERGRPPKTGKKKAKKGSGK